jgi:hypothetical protein
MTTTKIRPQTVPADVPEDAERLPAFRVEDADEVTGYWLRAWSQRIKPITPKPNQFRLLFNAEWHVDMLAEAPQRTARAAQLRELARWSVSEANLDWDHLRSIDRTGWGASD